ncbi:MAG: hypothetical protein LC130_14065, partial [Bryobacterales bacterium]|nr:hypothetical protein [Bryobacterales bacterium]
MSSHTIAAISGCVCAFLARGQVGSPTREYIRVNGCVIAIEQPAPAQPPGIGITVSPSTVSLAGGQTQQFTA